MRSTSSAAGARSSAIAVTRPPCRPWRWSATRTRGRRTLFNLLTGGEAVASDALFVTLDPLVRKVKLPDRRELLVSDTVGFIDRLPHSLVAAFRATLEEVAGADLLLHVIDASSPDREPSDGGGDVGAVRGRRASVCRPSRSSTSGIGWTRGNAPGCARCIRARCASRR